MGPFAKLHLPFGVGDLTDKVVADGGPFAASAITATGMARSLDVVYDNLVGPVFGRILKAVGADDVPKRAGLCATQLVGIGVVPTLQRYLIGDIS